MIGPAWMAWAYAELRAGVREVPGAQHHPRILEYFRLCGASWVLSDEVAWCAAGVGAGLVETTRVKLPAGPLRARSYLRWGAALDPNHPAFGAVAVFSRGSGPQPGADVVDAPGHVGLVVALGHTDVILLGANQGDSWSVRPFPLSSLLGVRWPAAA